MAGFINWNNMGSITETSDAIAEREQALEPVQFDSNLWTSLGIANQRAITPTAPTAYEQRKASLEEATERNKAILGDKLAQDAEKRDELLIASGADENQVKQNRQLQTEIKNKDSLERIENHIASKSDPLNKVSFFDEDLENAIHNLSRNEVIELYAGKPELRDYILSQQGYATNQLAKTGLYTGNAASVFGNAASVGLGAAGEEAALLDWANYTAKSLTGSSESEKTKAITEGLSNKLNNLSDEYRDTAARLSDESTAARQELTDWEYDKKIAQQKINGLRGSEVNQDTVGRELSKVKDVLSDGYQVTKEIAQEVPSTIATLGVAKGVTSGAKAVAKSLTKDKIEANLAKKEARYIAEQKAKTELTEDAIRATPEFAKAQEVAKKNIDAVFARKSQKHSGKIITGWETVSSGAQNGVPAYSDAASFILNQDDKSFKESKGFKDLQKENPDITVDDAKQVLANRAGEEAMLRAFFSSAILGAAFSNAERKLFDRLFKGKSLATIKERAKSFGISVGSNAAQEFGEEASSKLYSNLAINNALGYKAVDESRDVLSSGLYGAITGGATTTLTNTPELIGSAKKAGINKLKEIRSEVLDNKKAKNTAEAFDNSFTSDEIKQDAKSFRESQKEASSIVSQAVAGKSLTPEQQTRLDEINAQNAKLDDKYESAIAETTRILKDVDNKRLALNEFAERDDSDTEEGFNKFIDMSIDTLKTGGVTDAQLASIESKLSKASLAEKAMHYNREVDALFDALLDKRDAQIAAKDAQFRGIDTPSTTVSHEDSSVNPTALSSIDVSSLKPEDIQVKEDKVSIKGKDFTKDDVANAIVNHIKSLSLDKEIPLGKEIEHLKSSLESIKQLEDLYKDLESKGIKPNANLGAMFKALNKVTKGLDTNNISPAEAITLQEQVFGSKYKGKVNRGLLHYAKEAVMNQGKLSTNSRLALSKFIRSQTGKAAAVQDMIRKMRNDELSGKFNPDGYTFTNEDTASQLTQSGENRKFTSIAQAEKYAKAVRRIQSEFLNFATDVATKKFTFEQTPVTEEKVVAAQETESVKPTKPSRSQDLANNLGIHAEVKEVDEPITDGAKYVDGVIQVDKNFIKDKDDEFVSNLIAHEAIHAKLNLLEKALGKAEYANALENIFNKFNSFTPLMLTNKNQAYSGVGEYKTNPFRRIEEVLAERGSAVLSGSNKRTTASNGVEFSTNSVLPKDGKINHIQELISLVSNISPETVSEASKYFDTAKPKQSKIDMVDGLLEHEMLGEFNGLTGLFDSILKLPDEDAQYKALAYPAMYFNGYEDSNYGEVISSLTYSEEGVTDTKPSDKSILDMFREYKKTIKNTEEQVDSASVEITAESNASTENLFNYIDEFNQDFNEEIKTDLSKLSETELEDLLLKNSKDFKAMALPMYSAIVDYARKGKEINFKTLLNNLTRTGKFNPNNLRFIETMMKEDLNWVVGNILFNRLVQTIQTLPKGESLHQVKDGRALVDTTKKTQLLNQVADEVTSSITSKVNVYATTESLSSIAVNKDNQAKLLSLIHQNLQTQTNQNWIKDTSKEYDKTNPSMNQEFKYTVDGGEHTMPMWLALEYRNKGIALDGSELKDLGIGDIKESVISKYYDDLLAIADGDDNTKIVKELGLKDEDDINFIHDTANLLKAVKDHLYKSIPDLLKDPTKQAYGLGVSGIYNFLQLSTDTDGRTAVVIPKELVQLMAANVLNGLQTMNNLSSANTKETEDFLFDKGYSVEVTDTTNGSYQGKKVELDLSSLGSNQNYLVSQLGTKGIKFLNTKSNQQNTALYQAISTALGVETLNFIQEQGVLRTQQVSQFVPREDGEKGSPVNTYKFVAVNWGKLQRNPMLDNLVKFANTDLVNKTLGVNTVENEYQIVGLKDSIGKLSAENAHVATEFTSGNNQEVKDALNVYNNQEWALDTEFLELQDKLGDIYDLATDGFDDSEPMTEKSKASATSKAQQLYRAKEKLQNVIAQGKALGAKSLKDIRFKGLYELMSNSRVNMKSSVNPQNIKYHRESMNLVQRDAEGNEIEYVFIKPDLQGNSLGEFAKTANEDMKMFALSLAQALGVKIEKKSLNEIFTELDGKLALPENQGMLELIQSPKVTKDAATKAIAKAFQKEHGNGGHRAIKALMTYANFMKAEPNSSFNSNLFLEADGIGNGMHNIVMQFNTYLSGDMLKSLLKTGVITTDRIAEAYQKAKEKDPSVSLDTVINNMEGSAEIFSKELSKDIPKDVYEDVSNAMAQSIQEAFLDIHNGLYVLQQYVPHNIDSIPQYIQQDGKERINHAIELIRKEMEGASSEQINALSQDIKALRKVGDAINLITILDLSGSLKDANTKESLLGLSISDVSAVSGDNFVNELVAEISRAFAKAGVTPATYGGKLNGISQQLIKNVMSDLTSLADKLYAGTDDIAAFTKNWNKFVTVAYSSNALPTEFTLYFDNNKKVDFDLTNLLKSETKMEEFLKTIPDIKETINDMLNMSFDNKSKIETSLKSGVASLLNKAVQSIYGEALGIASEFLAFTDPMFEVFHDEFLQKVDDKITERNLAKGWAVNKNGTTVTTNPKGYDGLTKQEYKAILKTMQNLPVVATAFSQNNTLLDSLVHTGMSNIKTSNTSNLGKTSISSIYKNRQTVEFLSATIATQIKEYQQAGASTFTNTVVSVESKAQADAQKRANKEGKAFLDVFDGGDALAAIAQVVGRYLNEASYAGHQAYSVMDSLWNMYNNSDLWKVAKLFNGSYKLSDHMFKANGKVYLDKPTVNALKLFQAIHQSGLKVKGLDKTASNISLILGMPLDSSVQGVEVLSGLMDELNKAVTVLNNRGLDSLFTAAMDKKAEEVASHRATMAVLNQLPIKYNQFAGSSRGVALNTDSALANKIISDLIDYELNSTDDLATYVMSNKELNDIYVKEYQKELAKLHLNKDASYSVDTSSIDTVIKDLEKVEGNSNQEKTYKVLFNIVKPLVQGMNIKLLSKEDILENSPELAEQLAQSKAMYIPNKGLYLPKGITNVEALHELLHFVLADSFSKYASGKADSKTKAAIGEIISIAKALNTKLSNKDTINLFNELSNTTSPNLKQSYLKVSKIQASVTNLLFAFDEDATKHLSQEQKENLKYEALQEFTAYSFTEADSIALLAKTTTNRGFKKILNTLLDFFKQIHSNISKMFGVKPSDDFARSSLVEGLTYIQALASNKSGTNEQALSSYKDLANMTAMIQGSNNSSEFKNFLNDLTTTIKQSVKGLTTVSTSQLGDTLDYPQQLAMYTDDDIDAEAKNYLAGLRSTGIKVTDGEEVAFVLMNKLLKINRSLGNVSGLEQGNNLMQAVIEKISPTRFMGQSRKAKDRFSAVFTKDTDHGLALLLTNETFRKEMLKHTAKGVSLKGNAVHKWLKGTSESEKLLDLFAQYKDPASINSLAHSLAQIDVRNALKNAASIDRRIEEQKANDRDIETLNKIYEVFGKGSKISDVIGAVASVGLSGKDRLTYNEKGKPEDESTFVGKLIDLFLGYDVSNKGRTTAISTFMSWLLGEREDTHRIHALHNEHLTNLDKVRERVGGVTKKGLSEFFKNKPSDEQNKLIHKMFRTNLHGYFAHSSSSSHDFALINDSQFINDKLNDYSNEIKQLIDTEVTATPKVKDQIYNYLMWQSNGLADLQRNNEAKSMESQHTHNIMPNSRMISSLKQLNGVLKFTLADGFSDKLNDVISARTALVSFNGLPKEDQDAIVNYAKEEKAALHKLMLNSQRIHSEAQRSLLGRDGYVVGKKDPHYDLQIVKENDTESYMRLKKLGYVEKAKLANGEIVMSTDGALSNRYKTGMFALTEFSSDGVNTNDYSIQGVTSTELGKKHSANLVAAADKQLVRALNDPDYYNKLAATSNYQPVINEQGEVVRYEASVPYEMADNLVPSREQGYESLANMSGRLVEEMVASRENKRYVDILADIYNTAKNKQEFIQITSDFKIKGNTNLDKQFENKIRTIYNTLPQETKNYIDEKGGLYIPIKEVNNILGYHETWLSDVFTGKSYFPEPVQVAIRGAANVFGGIAGIAPAKAIRVMEEYLKETTSLSKDYILNRSLIVPLGNLLSNVLHLVQWGINPVEIPKLMKEGYTNAIQYQKYMNELDKINFLLKQGGLSSAAKLKYEAKQNQLNTLIKNSPVHSLVQGGILTSITALEIGDDQDEDTSRLGKLESKLGLNTVYNNTPEIVKSVLLKKDSKAHDFFVKTLDYGDFVAKYALYKHLLRKGKSEYHAMNVIREEFINYSANRGAFFDWMNATGLTWFLNYKLGIQKVIFRSFRRNFLRTAAIMSSDSFVSKAGLDPLGIYQTVPSQYLEIGNVLPFGSYQTSNHLLDGFESHYIARLIELLK
jgi:N4 v-RNAP-like protein